MIEKSRTQRAGRLRKALVSQSRLIRWGSRIILGGVILIFALWVSLNTWIVYTTDDRIFARVDDVPYRQNAIVPGALVHPSGYP